MVKKQDFSGTWQAYRWHPSPDDSTEEVNEYKVSAYQTGHDVIFQSVPSEDGSYLLIRLTINGDVATGTWFENAPLDSEFHGAMYDGAGQLIISDDKRNMEGLWAGAGMDHKLNKLRIYTGRWELKYLGDKA
jgi:hypothetical protein